MLSFGRATLTDWPLDPGVTYLNHGTVGVTPRVVLEAQQRIRDAAERAPAQFLFREQWGMTGLHPRRPSLMRAAAAAVAEFVGASADDLVFVDNATTGVNTVLQSVPFEPGDEIVVTDHGYGAIANAVRFVAGERRVRVVTVPVPYPRYSADGLVEAVTQALSARTRLVLIDHITSESALILPVAQVAAVCRARGVRVLVDGAHAPGVLPLDVPALGVDWYVANLHKWACAPRSAGFLWASRAVQEDLRPLVISWGFGEGFVQAFDWVGTRDASAYLAAPTGLAFLRERGVEAAWAHNHGLAWEGAHRLADAWNTAFEPDESSVGMMATVPVPPVLGSTVDDAVRLRDALLEDHRIEVQVHASQGRVWVRMSAQTYNDSEDVARLARAVQVEARRR